jgi:hypothetical protein
VLAHGMFSDHFSHLLQGARQNGIVAERFDISFSSAMYMADRA